MKPVSLLLAVGVSLAAVGTAVAQERPRSLNDARSDVNQGAGGITLFDFGRKAEPAPEPRKPATPGGAAAPAGAAAAPAATSGWGTPLPATAAAPQAPRETGSGFFGRIGSLFAPPSGEAMSAAKKHESASSGIAIPGLGSILAPPSGESMNSATQLKNTEGIPLPVGR